MGKTKVEPANLTDKQKEDIKRAILKQFPTLSIMQEELGFAIDEYSKDRNYIKNLMKKEKPIEEFVKEAPETQATIEVIKKGTPEYDEIVKKMEENAKKAASVVPDEQSCKVEEVK